VTAPVSRDDDSPREACGVFGIYAPGRSVAPFIFDGLYALQHRGQESAGMAVSDGQMIFVEKDMGLVSNVFTQYGLAALEGHLGIGHTRYSTTGSSERRNAQPVYRSVGEAGFALGHNGNLTNSPALAEGAGMLPGTAATDTDLVAELLAAAHQGTERSDGRDLELALRQVLPKLEGAFSFTLMDTSHLIGVRDPNGFRPLCLGKLGTGWVLASETPALDVIGAQFVRELDPGEMLVIDATGVRSVPDVFPAERIKPSLCLFEFVYLARPDAQFYGKEVYGARRRMGERLAEQAPAEADLVIGVPESALPAAEGYASKVGIQYGEGLAKNRYIGRTFIFPDQAARAKGVRRKLNPLRQNVAGKRLVVVDDTIVRGTTTREMVRMLREAGATEVHLRVSAPPIKWPCFYGIDMGTRGELLAADLSVDEIQRLLGVDSLAYLTLDRLITAVEAPGAGFCTACLSGEYPVTADAALSKDVLEDRPTRV
jgi:amidophosphoribosyltransferase